VWGQEGEEEQYRSQHKKRPPFRIISGLTGEGKTILEAILRHLSLLCSITDHELMALSAARRHLQSSRPGLKEEKDAAADGDVQDKEGIRS